MVISKTPYRISFFGGGTDYPEWYIRHGGAVLSTTIDKYCYITCRYLPPFFDHRYRVVYSKVENRKTIYEIEHPSVREVLKYLDFEDAGLEIHHDGDLPARSGMGSSSAFTVGLLNALYALLGKYVSKTQLLADSLHIEQEIVQDYVGSQDQAASVFGGFNYIKFSNVLNISSVIVTPERLKQLNDSLMLFFTGISRQASTIAKSYDCKNFALYRMQEMVTEGLQVLCYGNLDDFGELLHEGWELKKSLSKQISTDEVDVWYEKAKKVGAIGGKLTGAGGGGFLLFYVPPEKQPAVKLALSNLLHVPFKFEKTGSQIIVYDI